MSIKIELVFIFKIKKNTKKKAIIASSEARIQKTHRHSIIFFSYIFFYNQKIIKIRDRFGSEDFKFLLHNFTK